MKTEESRALVLSYLEAQGRGDVDAMNRLLADDLEWVPPASVLEPIRGREAVQAAMAELGAKHFDLTSMKAEIHKVLADGDTVAIPQRLEAKTSDGRDYANEYCWVYTCRDGQIVRMVEHTDSLTFDRIMNG
jgi:uncharacterized protein (TIGR02246 family)